MTRLWLVLATLGVAACGDETGMIVIVDLAGRAAPSDLDTLRLDVSDAGETIGRNVALPDGITKARVRLEPGGRMSGALSITATAYLGTVIVSSVGPRTFRFEDGETGRLKMALPPP